MYSTRTTANNTPIVCLTIVERTGPKYPHQTDTQTDAR